MRRLALTAIFSAAAALALPQAATAWTRPGHMVTAAIAFEEIERRRPDLIAPLTTMLEAHPDRAPFQVAIDRTTGRERARRLFLECARWPDDARQTAYDHPSWHIVFWPVAEDAPEAVRARLAARKGRPTGQALEGLALNYGVLTDPSTTAGDRAVSLCWILHVAADIHQPFHATELFSATYPEGDGGGGRQFVRDPLTGEPIALHWLWDDAVHRAGDPDTVVARAKAIMTQHPRASLPEVAKPADIADARAWAHDESHDLALRFALTHRPPTSPDPAAAPAVPEPYWRQVRALSERRVAVAGYRLADLVIGAFDAPR